MYTHLKGYYLSVSLVDRLIGGPTIFCSTTSLQSKMIRSGYAITLSWAISMSEKMNITSDRVVGGYLVNNYDRGVLPFPFSTYLQRNPVMYSSLYKLIHDSEYQLNNEVESDIELDGGFVWSSFMYDLYWRMALMKEPSNTWTQKELGSNNFISLMILSLKIMPCSPSFADARRALLVSAKSFEDGVYYCRVVTAFARRGFGEGISDSSKVTQFDSFDIPSNC
jgi:hypothetical protein